MLRNLLILCILFFSACTTQQSTAVKEKEKIEAFLNQFLFVEGGVFSIFGDKPLSEILIFTGDETSLAELTEEELKTALFVERPILEDWKAWKQFISKIPSKNYLFVERPCSRDPDHTLYFVMNVQRVKEVLHQYKPLFQQKTGLHIGDTDHLIQDFKNPKSHFWDTVLEDHYLSGLLFGYGEENIAYFLKRSKIHRNDNRFSDEFNPCASPMDFPIPIFAISPGDKTTVKYREQKKTIQAAYSGRDIVTATLEKLCPAEG